MINMPTGCIMADIKELVPYKKNPKNHTDKDIDLIVKSVKRNGWGDPLLVCPETMEVLSGNGRLLAGEKLGMEQVPVVYAPKGLTEKQKADLVIASNKLVEVSGYNANLDSLIEEFGLDIEDFGMKAKNDTKYTRKVSVPVYEITGDCPNYKDMIDTDKADGIIEEIEKSSISDSDKEFLKLCATRLYEYRYDNIAEYYAHADKETQGLMEKLALVVIDFDKAIENGYVELNSFIEENFLQENDIEQ